MASNAKIFLSPPHMSGREKSLIDEVFLSNYIAPLGPMVDRFENDFCAYSGYEHAVALISGTAAIHLALLSLGIKPNDFVWSSTLTFIGSVAPIIYCNANPVFIDASWSDWNIDIELLEKNLKLAAKLKKLPKALIVTDLYGQPCDYDELYAVCEPYGIPIISDSAESLGSSYKNTRSPARIAIYSFNGNKIITTAGGGILASKDPKLVQYARHLSQQARDPYPFYQHSVIGYNYRLSNVSAAIGVGQLSVLQERVAKKKAIYEYYKTQLADIEDITFIPVLPHKDSNFWLTVITLSATSRVSPEHIRQRLEANNIEARPVWKPMHLQPVFAGCQIIGGSVSESLFQRGLCLPSGTALEQHEQDRIIGIIRSCLTL
jgi:dTDP-4-amino-4,6-dideoxygalactose transaminase